MTEHSKINYQQYLELEKEFPHLTPDQKDAINKHLRYSDQHPLFLGYDSDYHDTNIRNTFQEERLAHQAAILKGQPTIEDLRK